MHGFLNVFLAAVFCYNGLGAVDARRMVELEDPAAIEFGDESVRWEDYVISNRELASIRRRFAISFGSCSFHEPIDDLEAMQLLKKLQ